MASQNLGVNNNNFQGIEYLRIVYLNRKGGCSFSLCRLKLFLIPHMIYFKKFRDKRFLWVLFGTPAKLILALGGPISISPPKINTVLYTWVISVVFHALEYYAVQTLPKAHIKHTYTLPGRASASIVLNKIKQTRALENPCFDLKTDRRVVACAYQLLIGSVWVINVTLIRSLSVTISRDCHGAANLMIFSWFCLQTASDFAWGFTQDERFSGRFCCASMPQSLFGVWLSETVQLWGDDPVQSERLENLKEDFTYQYNATVSIFKRKALDWAYHRDIRTGIVRTNVHGLS